MLPTLNAGDELLVDPRAYRSASPQAGDIVVAWHPIKPDLKIIKRVGRVEDDGRVYLISDNPQAGSDSRAFGAIAPALILGRVNGRFG